jgi:hypothetical protein
MKQRNYVKKKTVGDATNMQREHEQFDRNKE